MNNLDGGEKSSWLTCLAAALTLRAAAFTFRLDLEGWGEGGLLQGRPGPRFGTTGLLLQKSNKAFRPGNADSDSKILLQWLISNGKADICSIFHMPNKPKSCTCNRESTDVSAAAWQGLQSGRSGCCHKACLKQNVHCAPQLLITLLLRTPPAVGGIAATLI